ncbi:hypothetical protein MNEG_3879 [Monoraphidium neglectum]|uniref:Uncharacterized protein n=1 Tax=Monoraphidium neglectum TaxID=145388 RepID=A0A0D2K045_9CHLO|nr:hypothetical protein MNEG_3879 [Monoraphidium neglectum]KIZ04078.1 hypothetical protein MNEG_3879 [Monoraphidium neglectum]|eukprot:XP_013903097.1 hypothetical protein MNEG_3879 [Monoraphidium neglectum]
MQGMQRLLLVLVLLAVTGGSDAARLLRQIVQSEVVRQNPAYAPTLATTVGSNGGQAAALSNPNSAGVFVQSGRVASAGDLLPGPTGRVAAGGAGGTGGALQSGLGELPIVSTGTIAAASTYGSGGAAVAVAAPSAYYVGGGSRATAIGDVTGLYGGSLAASNSDASGRLGGGPYQGDFSSAVAGQVASNGLDRADSIGGRRGGGGGGGGRRGSGSRGSDSSSYGGFGDSGFGGQTSFAGAQTFDAVAYGVSGTGGPVAVAAAGEALAVSQAGGGGWAGDSMPARLNVEKDRNP